MGEFKNKILSFGFGIFLFAVFFVFIYQAESQKLLRQQLIGEKAAEYKKIMVNPAAVSPKEIKVEIVKQAAPAKYVEQPIITPRLRTTVS